MIANPNWFTQRKYGGWGLTPKGWQGWAYIIAVIIPIALVSYLPIPDNIKTPFMFIWSGIFMADLIHTMFRIKRDERDIAHEAIAERNALWIIILSLIIGIAYQVASGIVTNQNQVDPVIVIALLSGAIAKSITHLYLRQR